MVNSGYQLSLYICTLIEPKYKLSVLKMLYFSYQLGLKVLDIRNLYNFGSNIRYQKLSKYQLHVNCIS